MLYDASILILTAIIAVGTVILVIPVLRSWLKPKQEDLSMDASANALTNLPRKARWSILLVIAVVTLGVSLFGLYRIQRNAGVVHFPQTDIEHLTYVHGKHYFNEEVKVDGIHFDGCTFENVTLAYDGTDMPGLTNNQFDGSVRLKTNSDSVMGTIALLVGLGFMKPGIPVLDRNNEPMKHLNPAVGSEEIR